jgi:hypothetical protein
VSDPRYPGRPGPYAGQQQGQQQAGRPGYPSYRPELEETTQLPAFGYQADLPPDQPMGLFAGSPVLVWTLRALGLIAVAVISGLVWYYITNDNNPGPSQQADQPAKQGKYDLVAASQLPKPVRDSNCVEHSKGQVQAFLREHQCRGLVRQLFTVVVDGRTAYVSVSSVEMANAQDAAALETLTKKDGTGNIKDLVSDGKARVEGLKELDGDGGYASQHAGAKLIIVEGDFTPDGSKKDEPVLDDICSDALRLGPGLN